MPRQPVARVCLFGPLSIEVADRTLGPRDLGGRKPKQILEVLVLHRGELVPKERLIDLIWGERLPRDPVRTLEAAVSVLRAHVAEDPAEARDLVRSEPGAYRIPLDAVEVDLWRFDELASSRPGEALALVRGDVLADEPYAEWATPVRDLYDERVVTARLDRAEQCLTEGRVAEALASVDEALAAQPLRERGHRLRIAGHYLLGEQARALEAYDRCRQALVTGLGVSPLPETERVYLAVLNQERATEVVRAAVQPPYPQAGDHEPPPVTRFAGCRGATVAYQVVGDGPLDVVFAPGWFSHVEVGWEEPRLAAFLRRLARNRRVLLFDRRGTGMSDPVAPGVEFDERADDVLTVMDAAGSERAVVFGVSEGGPMGISVAARAPDRVAGLVLYSCFGRLMATPDYPWGWTREFLDLYRDGLDAAWSTGHGVEIALPSVTGDEALREWVCRYLRLAVSPAAARASLDLAARTDVRHHLGAVRCPTLVLHRRDELWLSPDNGRYVAAQIPAARFVELPGVDYWPWLGDADSVLEPVEAFLDDLGAEGFPRVAAGG